jgi:hypothetical protein
VKNGKQASQGEPQIKFGNLNIFIKKSNMVQPKYSPEEALQRAKLMMGYDTRKTLKENKEIIFEQAESCTNSISYEDLLSYVEQVEEAIDDTDNYSLTKDVMDSSEDAKDIYDAIKAVSGKNVYDEETGKCEPAVGMFKTKYKELNSQDWIGGNRTLDEDLSTLLSRNLSSESDRYVRLSIKMLNAPVTTVVPDVKKDEAGVKKDGKVNSGGGTKSTYTPCTPGKYVRGCKSEVVRKVQVCLKQAPKHQTGNFGPITQGNLQKLGKGFENGFTDADVATICQTEVKAEVKPEVGGEVQTVNATSTDF